MTIMAIDNSHLENKQTKISHIGVQNNNLIYLEQILASLRSENYLLMVEKNSRKFLGKKDVNLFS